MCSFAVSDRGGLLTSNDYAARRGPDYTSYTSINGINVVHNLLHITGERSIQPFEKNNKICVYNGEIYNYSKFKNYKSDGECLLDLYEEYGEGFASKLDGEYAIVLIDFDENKIILSSDCFSTKPMWYSFCDGIGIASFKTQLERIGFKNIIKQQHNTTNIFDLTTKKILNSFSNYTFCLHQHKDTFNDWNLAFQDSIRKRSYAKDIFIGLSSGFDSGLIALELTNQNIDFVTLSIIEGEDRGIIADRVRQLKNHKEIIIDESLYKEFQLLEYDEHDFKTDKAAFGIFNAFKVARELGKKVIICGHGADEIISDYGFNGKKIYEQSTFGGLFPNNLESVFPWNSFYEGTQQVYISKVESVASYFGIESRYPFLDQKLVQEFLWLTPRLKNTEYKGCIQNYLKQYNYPFALEKIGWPAAPCSLI